EAVCAAGGEATTPTLDVVASLIDKSLLVREERESGEARFRMLEVLREYALERLREGGDGETISRAHADVFLALADEATPAFLSSGQARWVSRLDEDLDNLRAAFSWLLEHDA